MKKLILAIALLTPCLAFAQSVKISQLPAASSVSGTDVTIVLHNGQTDQISIANLAASLPITFGNFTLANGAILIGQTSGSAAPETPSGDITLSNAGVFTLGTVASSGTYAFGNGSIILDAKGRTLSITAPTGLMSGSNNLSEITNGITAMQTLGVPFSNHVAISGSYTVQPTDSGKVLEVTTGTGQIPITLLGGSNYSNGMTVFVRKIDSSTGAVLVGSTMLLGQSGHTDELMFTGTSIIHKFIGGGVDASGNYSLTNTGNYKTTTNGTANTGTANVNGLIITGSSISGSQVIGTVPAALTIPQIVGSGSVSLTGSTSISSSGTTISVGSGTNVIQFTISGTQMLSAAALSEVTTDGTNEVVTAPGTNGVVNLVTNGSGFVESNGSPVATTGALDPDFVSFLARAGGVHKFTPSALMAIRNFMRGLKANSMFDQGFVFHPYQGNDATARAQNLFSTTIINGTNSFNSGTFTVNFVAGYVFAAGGVRFDGRTGCAEWNFYPAQIFQPNGGVGADTKVRSLTIGFDVENNWRHTYQTAYCDLNTYTGTSTAPSTGLAINIGTGTGVLSVIATVPMYNQGFNLTGSTASGTYAGD